MSQKEDDYNNLDKIAVGRQPHQYGKTCLSTTAIILEAVRQLGDEEVRAEPWIGQYDDSDGLQEVCTQIAWPEDRANSRFLELHEAYDCRWEYARSSWTIANTSSQFVPDSTRVSHS